MASEKKVFQTREEMPPRYRETLEQMMKSQAYRELAAARMFGHGLQYVDSSKWLKFLVWHIGEEMDGWVNERLDDKPIPFAQSWFELAMAQFLYDRGGFW